MKGKERIKERMELNRIKKMYKESEGWIIGIKGINLVMRNW